MKKPLLRRLAEFFEADDGRLSMTRLLSFMAFFPATWVVYTAEDANRITAMSILVGAYVLQSGVNTIGTAIKK